MIKQKDRIATTSINILKGMKDMKKIRNGIPKKIVTVLVLSLISLSANAAKQNTEKHPMTNLYQNETWAGAYFGLHFGSGAGDVDTDYSSTLVSITPGGGVISTGPTTVTTIGQADLDGDANGSLADLFVGYNFHPSSAQKFIFGGQLEGTFFSDIVLYSKGTLNKITTSTDTTAPSTSSSSTFEYKDDLRSMFTFLIRAGYLVRPNLLVYALGGGVEGHFVLANDNNGNNNSSNSASPSGLLDAEKVNAIPAAASATSSAFGDERGLWELGYTAGAGLEYRLNNNWSLRGEYRFIHFDIDRDPSTSTGSSTTSSGTTSSGGTTSFDADFDTDFDFNMGKIGIVYRFDPPPAMPVGK